MEPRIVRMRETTLVLQTGSPRARRQRGRVVEFKDAPNRDRSRPLTNTRGNLPPNGTYLSHNAPPFIPNNLQPPSAISLPILLKTPPGYGRMGKKQTRSLVEFLSRDLPTTYKDLMEKTYIWIKAKEVATNRAPNDHKEGFDRFNKGFSWDNNKGKKRNQENFSPYNASNHGLLTNLSNSLREILATEKVAKTFELPPRMVGNKRSHDMPKYCHFHEDHRHETNQCLELRHQIKEAIKSGQLANLVKGIKKGKAKASNTQLVIIRVRISERQVNRVYMDSGNSCEVIYEHCFLKLKPSIRSLRVDSKIPLVGFLGERSWPPGEFPVEVTVGETPHIRIETLNFVIIRSNSPNNLLLRRTQVPRVLCLITCSQQLEVEGEGDENVPLYYYVTDNLTIQFGREEFCLVTSLKFGVENVAEYGDAESRIPFRRRVFLSNLDGEPITGTVSCAVEKKGKSFGSMVDAERVPRHVNRQNMYEVPSELYQQLEEQKRDIDKQKKEIEEIKNEAKQLEMFEKMHKFMEDMNVEQVRPANKEPIIVSQHYGISDLSQFPRKQVKRENYVNYTDFLNHPEQIYLYCYMKGYSVLVTFWQQLVPHLYRPNIDSRTPMGWLSAEDYSIQQIRGSPYEAFEMLSYYCYNLEQKNEGTVTRIKTDEKGVFEMLFIAIGASIRTFLNYLCPVLMIDVAHLKGPYKGTNLVVVAKDGNNQIVSIAFGICKGETGPRWSWHAAIALAVENEFPLAFHAHTKWQKKPEKREIGLPCGHVIDVTRFLGLTDCVQYVSDWFKKPKYQGTYLESIHFLRNMQQWEFSQNIHKAIPPRMDNPQPGRPKNTKRIQSQGEEPRVIHCSRCTQAGHRRDQCNKPFVVEPPGNIRTQNVQDILRNNEPSFYDPNQHYDNTFHTFNQYTTQPYDQHFTNTSQAYDGHQTESSQMYEQYNSQQYDVQHLDDLNTNGSNSLVPLADAIQERDRILMYTQHNRLHVYVSRVELSTLVVAEQHKDEKNKTENQEKPSCSKKLFD
ncbi:hypothetical protein Tco_0838579 [Tanacetum coccineum]|uniref:Transposase, MuDR, MULE transposase domain protein n=1 Tax=Tanacetum coccineum TaxID=301880 RepID=A0ABQ5AR17_9ASTR